MMTEEPISTREGNTVDDMLREARQRAVDGITFWGEIYQEAESDLKFGNGDQWPTKVKQERDAEGRPCLTINTLPQYLGQILGDQRQNKPAIKVIPVHDDGGMEFKNQNETESYSGTEVMEGIIRNIEYESNAEAHYDRAFNASVRGGIGWLRVIAQYTSDDVFEQVLRIKRVANSFSVLIDPEAEEPDYSDANWGMIFSKVPNEEFRKRWPDKRVGDLSVDLLSETDSKYWLSQGYTVVAEYFTREPRKRELLRLSNGVITYMDEVKDVLDELAADGITIETRRKVVTHQVYWRKITAFDELESKREWPGTTIPLVPVLGKEVQIGEKRYYNSAIKHSKDPSQMQNYWLSAATERVALAPKAPWLVPWESIKKRLLFWNKADKNLPFLPYDETKTGAMPRRETPPTMPAGEIQMAMTMGGAIQQTMGMYEASVGDTGNEISGRAIMAKQRKSDTGSFEFVDNLSMAIRRIGQILIETIPKIYDSERTIRIAFPDGDGDFVRINYSVLDRQKNKWITFNDIGFGKYNCVVKTGPAYATKRIETLEALVAIIQAVPSVGNLIMDKIFKFMDIDEAKEISDRLKKALPPGILDQKEIAELGIQPPAPPQPPPPTPKDMADAAKAQADMAMADAKKMEANARMAEAQVKMQELATMANDDAFAEKVRDLVAASFAELIDQLQNNNQTVQQQPPMQP